MRDLIDCLTQEIQLFVEQRDDLILLVACTSQDAAIALKLLRDVDRGSQSDLFLLFADDFQDTASFVLTVVTRLRDEHQLACEDRSRAGEVPLPAFPDWLLDRSQKPVPRLHAALEFARSLLPTPGSHRLVWAMLPAHVASWSEYLEIVSSCAPRHEKISPWMRGVRLISRVQEGFAFGSSPLADAERTRLTRIDFGPEALERSFRNTSDDPTVPEHMRMEALLPLSMLSAAHGRFEEAIRQSRLLLSYCRKTDQPLMQAVILNNLGDISRRQSDMDGARRWYECASSPAARAKQPVVLGAVVQNLASLAYEQERYAEAEAYFDALATLKQYVVDEDGKAMALEWRGLSQERQAAYDRAILSWEEAGLLARVFQLHPRLRPLLEHLERAYGELGQVDKQEAVQTELRELAEVRL